MSQRKRKHELLAECRSLEASLGLRTRGLAALQRDRLAAQVKSLRRQIIKPPRPLPQVLDREMWGLILSFLLGPGLPAETGGRVRYYATAVPLLRVCRLLRQDCLELKCWQLGAISDADKVRTRTFWALLGGKDCCLWSVVQRDVLPAVARGGTTPAPLELFAAADLLNSATGQPCLVRSAAVCDVLVKLGLGLDQLEVHLQLVRASRAKQAAKVAKRRRRKCVKGLCAQTDDQVRREAARGRPEAQYELGLRYAKRDELHPLAIEWYTRAAEQGLADAQLELARWYRSSDPVLACRWAGRAAEQDHPAALYQLAEHLQSGEGTDRDEARALQCLAVAAGQAHADAELALAERHLTGRGVSQSAVLAWSYYQRAFQHGQAAAGLGLACCCAQGIGTPQNRVAAMDYYRQAAARGSQQACVELGQYYAKGVARVVNKHPELAFRYFKQAVEDASPHPEVLFLLGKCYQQKLGTARDDAAAVRCCQRAAELGFAKAQRELGACYLAGRGVAKDSARAVTYYQLAAEQGLPAAQLNLGWCYARGTGVARDLAKAEEWWGRAADQGCHDAQAELARARNALMQETNLVPV